MPLSKIPVAALEFVQSTPSDVWLINHGAPGYPIVDVYVNEGNTVQKILPLSVAYVDAFNVEIRFSRPRAGFAVMVI